MKTTTYKMAKVIRTIAATLILMVAISGVSKGENSGRELCHENNGLTVQVKSWMGNNTYWSDFDNQAIEELQNGSAVINDNSDSQNRELSTDMESWINNCTYWSNESDNHEVELTQQIKSWIGNSNFWSAENDDNDKELAAQIKSWMSSKIYLNDSERQINTGNQLANN